MGWPTRDANGRFVRGESGNKAGKPAGTVNRRTKEVRDLLDRLTPAVLFRSYELLQENDPTALEILADRTLPRRRLVQVDLPVVRGLADIATAQQTITQLVSGGELDPSEGADLAATLDRFGAAVERAELERRIADLEANAGSKR